MKHRIAEKPRHFLPAVLRGGLWLDLRRRWWATLVVALLVSTGGVVSWQVAGHRGPTEGQHSRAVAAQPILPSTDPGRDEERANRGTPRRSLPATTPTPTATVTAAPTSAPAAPPATVAPTTSSAEPEPEQPEPGQTTPENGEYVAIGPSFSGEASFYGGSDGTDGGPTASGETFDANALTAASPSLPFDTLLNVCFENRCVVVRINDRGPFVGGRILDLSVRAARLIEMYEVGVGTVTATPVRAVD